MFEVIAGIDPRVIFIPLISGVIGYVTNWFGVRMIFFPVKLWGVRIPGLEKVAQLLPRRLQPIPGLLHGVLGWQGIVPSRAAKMGSIAVDKGIAKLGNASEFYEELEPELMAQHILASSAGEIRDLVDEILTREHPRLWINMPAQVRERVHERVQEQLPEIVREVTDQIGEHIDSLLDIKMMVIRHIEARPELGNRIFLEVGRKELDFVVNAGLGFGVLLGIPTVIVHLLVDSWWVLPIAGVLVGYLTNLIAVRMIFLPIRPRRIGPITLHGLFMRRQPEVSKVYARIIADDVITLANIGEELRYGPQADRTHQMIRQALRPAIDKALGPARAAVRMALGRREYDELSTTLTDRAASFTMIPLADASFNLQQADRIQALIEQRMLELPPDDFAEMLRTAIEEDEWMLIFVGGVLGFVAGCLQALTTL